MITVKQIEKLRQMKKSYDDTVEKGLEKIKNDIIGQIRDYYEGLYQYQYKSKLIQSILDLIEIEEKENFDLQRWVDSNLESLRNQPYIMGKTNNLLLNLQKVWEYEATMCLCNALENYVL